MARFVTSNKHMKEIGSLLALKKRNDETVCQYVARYWELFNKIEGSDEVISARGFKLGLNTNDEQVYWRTAIWPVINQNPGKSS